MTGLDQTLAAVAEPTRRRVIDLLAERPRSAGDLAREISISAPLMSRHLRTLRIHGLVEEKHVDFRDTRIRTYQLRPEPFDELRRWLERVEGFWKDQLGSLREHVERKRGRRR